MGTVSRLDHDRARNNPEAVFERPEALAAEVGLTRGEKIATLKRWEVIVRRRLDSSDEGMGQNWRGAGESGEADRIEQDAELLQRIEIELDKLKAARQ